jgi:hypothetical protein
VTPTARLGGRRLPRDSGHTRKLPRETIYSAHALNQPNIDMEQLVTLQYAQDRKHNTTITAEHLLQRGDTFEIYGRSWIVAGPIDPSRTRPAPTRLLCVPADHWR